MNSFMLSTRTCSDSTARTGQSPDVSGRRASFVYRFVCARSSGDFCSGACEQHLRFADVAGGPDRAEERERPLELLLGFVKPTFLDEMFGGAKTRMRLVIEDPDLVEELCCGLKVDVEHRPRRATPLRWGADALKQFPKLFGAADGVGDPAEISKRPVGHSGIV